MPVFLQDSLSYLDLMYQALLMDPQQALDAPRWQWLRDGRVTVETRFPQDIARGLQRRGHAISFDINTSSFGRGQMIMRLANGVLVGGTESRTDSNIACW